MDVIRVSIGSEPLQLIPMLVLKSSILRRTRRPVEFSESWNPEQGWHPVLAEKTPLKSGTRFSGWRWIVPELYENQGKAIYLDADQLLLVDIAELWEKLESDKMFAAVCNVDPAGLWGKRTLEKSGKKFRDKVQTSVMVMSCRQCEWVAEKLFQDVNVGRMEYSNLMQAAFLPRNRIQELTPRWNDFGIVRHDTRLIHYSHVGSQPYRNPNHPCAGVFETELRYAVDSGMVTKEMLEREAENRHIHKHWLKAA